MGDLMNKKGIGNLDRPELPFEYSEREYGTVPLDHSKRAPFQWVSEVAYKNVHRIVARGYDTTELMEEGYGVPEVLFVDFQSRIPLEEESQMLNYVMILALEDGLSAPAIISRMVAQSKTFLTQACGASILAFGHAFGAYASFGKRMESWLKQIKEEGKSVEELVKPVFDDPSLGVSGLMLKDPAAKKLLERADKLGVSGEYIDLLRKVTKAAQALSDKPVDVDMLGATGAVMQDIGFSPEATWAILACTRAFAAGAHYIEEVERGECNMTGQTLTPPEFYDGPEDRPVPDKEERAKNAKSAQTKTLEDWKKEFERRKSIWGSGYSIIEEIEDPSEKTGIKKVGR